MTPHRPGLPTLPTEARPCPGACCACLAPQPRSRGRGTAFRRLRPALRSANGARDLSRRNVRTAQARPQNSKASFAYQPPCGLKSALRSANGARDLFRRNVATAQTRPQNSKASFAYQPPCGLKSALRPNAIRRLRGRAATATDHARRADGRCSTAIHEERAPISPSSDSAPRNE